MPSESANSEHLEDLKHYNAKRIDGFRTPQSTSNSNNSIMPSETADSEQFDVIKFELLHFILILIE